MPKPRRQRLPDLFRDGLIKPSLGNPNHECSSASPSPPRRHSSTARLALCHCDARRLRPRTGRRWRRRRCRARFAGLRPEQRQHIVRRPDARDEQDGDDELHRRLGELIQRQLHLLGYRSRRHLSGHEWRIGCSPSRQCSKQRGHVQRVRQRHRELHDHDHVALHIDLGWRVARLRFGRRRREQLQLEVELPQLH
jgi:hypothetical protein